MTITKAVLILDLNLKGSIPLEGDFAEGFEGSINGEISFLQH